MSIFSGIRARLALLVAPRTAEARINKEVQFHIEMESERLVREQGLSPDEARRRARANFGGVTQHTETLREGGGLAWLGGLTLDFKLGFRMLVKYPGLTVVGGLAMSFAIWVGAITFEMVMLFVNPRLPLPDGDRIVQVRNWDAAESRAEARSVYDFYIWRGALTSVTDLGAYRDVAPNLIVGGDSRPVQGAEISAVAFRIAPTPPLLGRTLNVTDENPGAPRVVVIGYRVWQTRFANDPNIVGRTVQLGETNATVIGVMPEGFAFPVSHDLWTPLKLSTFDQTPRAGASIGIFGKLAPGATLEKAQTELATLGARAAKEHPATHEHLQPQIAPYAKGFTTLSAESLGVFLAIPIFALMLLVLICGNVALLLFARAATRDAELAVRSALGATRGRIVAQLFAEALVLGSVAAVVGITAAQFSLRRWGLPFLEFNLGRLPFWYDLDISLPTVSYVIALTVLSAVISGVMPALKITRAIGARLKDSAAGSGSLKFGGVWTAVIVAQVAATVAFPAIVYLVQREVIRIRTFDVGFRSEQYLGVRVDVDAASDPAGHADSASARRLTTALGELRQRVAAEPGVTGVTFVDALPQMGHSVYRIELDEPAGVPNPTVLPSGKPVRQRASVAYIDPSYFAALENPILAGRGFHGGDLAAGARTVIVDQGFVDLVLMGLNPIGRRIRLGQPPKDGAANDPRPWNEIVGVVRDLGIGNVAQAERAVGIYVATTPGRDGPTNMIVHTQGDPLALGPRLRSLAAVVDPNLRLSNFQRLDAVANGMLWILGLWLRATMMLTAVALLLSLAGIYAVLSFIVARRTREIGVRVALGASQRRLVADIFRRPLSQVSGGIIAGGLLVAAGALLLPHTEQFQNDVSMGLGPTGVVLLVLYALFMFVVCLLACIVPTRRALGVEPTIALRAE